MHQPSLIRRSSGRSESGVSIRRRYRVHTSPVSSPTCGPTGPRSPLPWRIFFWGEARFSPPADLSPRAILVGEIDPVRLPSEELLPAGRRWQGQLQFPHVGPSGITLPAVQRSAPFLFAQRPLIPRSSTWLIRATSVLSVERLAKWASGATRDSWRTPTGSPPVASPRKSGWGTNDGL